MKEGLQAVALAHMDAFQVRRVHSPFRDGADCSSPAELVLLDVRSHLAPSFRANANCLARSWKTGISLSTSLPANPLWSYSLGLKEGYMPSNPRISRGFCANQIDILGRPLPQSPWSGTLKPNQVGGPGAGVPAPIESNRFPPERLGEKDRLDVSVLPVYEPNGTPIVLADSPPYTEQKGSGWYAPIPGCEYPNAWNAVGIPVPSARCRGELPV